MIAIKGKGKPSGYAAKFIMVKRNKTSPFMPRSKTSEDLPFREACYHLTLSLCKAKYPSLIWFTWKYVEKQHIGWQI